MSSRLNGTLVFYYIIHISLFYLFLVNSSIVYSFTLTDAP